MRDAEECRSQMRFKFYDVSLSVFVFLSLSLRLITHLKTLMSTLCDFDSQGCVMVSRWLLYYEPWQHEDSMLLSGEESWEVLKYFFGSKVDFTSDDPLVFAAGKIPEIEVSGVFIFTYICISVSSLFLVFSIYYVVKYMKWESKMFFSLSNLIKNPSCCRFKPKYVNVLFLMILIGLLFSNIFYVVLKVKYLQSQTFSSLLFRWSEHMRPGLMFMGQIRWPNIRYKIKYGMKLKQDYNKKNSKNFNNWWRMLFCKCSIFSTYKLSGSLQCLRADPASILDVDSPCILLPYTLNLPWALLSCFQVSKIVRIHFLHISHPHYKLFWSVVILSSQREPDRVCSHPGDDHDHPGDRGGHHRCQGHDRGLHRAAHAAHLLQHPPVTLPSRLRPRHGGHPHHAPHLCHGVDPGAGAQHQHLWLFSEDFPLACIQEDSVSFPPNRQFV